MALIALVGVASSTVVLSMVTLVTSANARLGETLVPLRVDAAELRLLYRQQALDLLSGEATAGELDNTVETARSLRDTIEVLAAGTGLEEQAAAVEQAADAWVARVMPAPGMIEPTAGTAELADLSNALDALSGDSAAAVSRQQTMASDAVRAARVTAVLAAVGLVAVAVAGAALLRRWIAVPVEDLTHQVDAASSDLSRSISGSGPAELLSIGEAVESMRRRMLDSASRRIDSALIAGHDAERSRIAGQIHDDQIQAMTLASIRLQQLRHKVGDDAELSALVRSAQDATNGAIARLRRMIFELHAPSLATDGLEAAVEEYLDETFGDEVGWSVGGDAGPLPPGVAALAFRLAREAMFNTFKHARAATIEVSFQRGPTTLSATIRDDGVGFDGGDSNTERGHLGFDHSRQLAAAAGGSWGYESHPGHGTVVRFTLPVEAVDAPLGRPDQ